MNAIVPRLSTCKESALSEETLSALEPTRLNGRLADVYLQFANSEPALQAYLGMEEALRTGSLNEQELECVKLLVSELTQCQYCLSVHSFKAKKAGISEEVQKCIRRGDPTGDARFDVLIRVVIALFKQPGSLDDSLMQELRAANFSDQNLVDICMAMSTIFFTNITNHINESESSLPVAPDIGGA